MTQDASHRAFVDAPTLAAYHARVFPWRLVHRFAAAATPRLYGKPKAECREWAFHVARYDRDEEPPPSTETEGGTEIPASGVAEGRVWRNRSFASEDAFGAFLDRTLVLRVELGALYSVAPSMERLYRLGAYAVGRELVFDVDASSYPGRACCGATNSVCARCWPLLACAASVVAFVLREQLGFERVLWLYSGGRGVHAWVCDALRSFTLAEGARRIVEHTCAALARISDATASAAGGANCARGALAPLVAIVENWRAEYARCQDMDASAVPFGAVVPRIDAEVSAQRQHLLRAPFSAHPRTGSLALPMPLCALQHFDPADAPRIDVLLAPGDGRYGAQRRLFDAALAHFADFCL